MASTVQRNARRSILRVLVRLRRGVRALGLERWLDLVTCEKFGVVVDQRMQQVFTAYAARGTRSRFPPRQAIACKGLASVAWIPQTRRQPARDTLGGCCLTPSPCGRRRNAASRGASGYLANGLVGAPLSPRAELVSHPCLLLIAHTSNCMVSITLVALEAY